MSKDTLATIDDFIYTTGLYSKERTMVDYRRVIIKFYSFVEKEVNEITASDVYSWTQKNKRVYNGKTSQVYLSILKSYLKEYAPQVKAGRIKTMKAYADHPSDTLTPEEYVSMLSSIKADTIYGVRDNLIIRMLYDTGARISEIHNLLSNTWMITGERMAFIKTAKTSQMRLIMWGEDTDVFLRTWLENDGGIFTIRSCQRMVEKYAKKAGIDKKITPHSFRHTKAHKILDNGGTIKDVSEVLGHLNLLSSQHYLRERDQERVIRQEKWL